MWLITTLVGAVIVTVIYFLGRENYSEKYKIHWLALMLWGGFLMILVDHVVGYLMEPGEFLEFETEGLVSSGILLGILMYIPVIVIWIVGVLISKSKR